MRQVHSIIVQLTRLRIITSEELRAYYKPIAANGQLDGSVCKGALCVTYVTSMSVHRLERMVFAFHTRKPEHA